MTRPSALVLLTNHLYREIFDDTADAALRSMLTLRQPDSDDGWTAAAAAAALPGVEVLITGWGSPLISAEMLAQADRLRLIAHSAGSIKRLISPAAFERGIAVTSAASAIAEAVADYTLLLILLGLRHASRYDRGLRDGLPWAGPWAFGPTHLIARQRIGIVGASFVGRRVVQRLRPLGAELWLADPYLSDSEATALGVTRVELDDLLRGCPIVTLHAPTTAETRHLINAARLALLADDALLINTARSWLVDQTALLRELTAGRIRAALDVFDQEPLPLDSPFRQLENVFITPHIAGATIEARRLQGTTVVAEIQRFLANEPLHFAITAERLTIMA